MITIRDLIDILENYPADWTLVSAKDSEGNSFSPVSDITMENYVPINAFSGALKDIGEFAAFDSCNSLVFWPIN